MYIHTSRKSLLTIPRTFITIFIFGLLVTTTLQVVTSPHAVFAGTDTYPAPWAPPTAQDSLLDTWKEYNRECTSYAAWMLHSVNGFEMPFNDDAVNWGPDATSKGYTVNMTPVKGSIYWSSGSDHVAYVESVSSDGKTITTQDYNSGYPTNPGWYAEHTGVATSSASGYIHFKDTGTNNTVLQVKKLTASDGTNEVVWSKATDVFESWWNNSSNGVHLTNLINISQGDIKSFDVSLYSNGEHDLFTATTNNIWETWWYAGQGLHTSEILTNIGNIRKIIKSVGPDGVTQQLYVLTDTGAYEYWWNSGSNGIQHDTIMTLANPVDEYKEIEADGTQALFIADQNYPYEQHWGNGISGLQQTTFSSVSGITSISYSQDSDAKHRLYIGASSGAIWEASWYNGSIGYWYMTGGSPVLQLQKYEDDSTQVIYEATTGGVYEYSWPTTSNTLSGRTIVGSLSNVHSFIRTTDPGNIQSVYTATNTNIDESWWPQGSNTITTGQIE